MFPLPETDKMGVVFPAGDAVAQFIVVLGAQRNDLSEGLHQVVDRAETDTSGTARYYHRLLVSHFFEAAKWLRSSQHKSPPVRTWLAAHAERSQNFKRDLEAVLCPTAPNGLIKKFLWAGRNATFHYPQVSAKRDGLEHCLAALEDAPVRIKRVPNEYGWEPRYEFAEHVLTYRFLHVLGDDLEPRMQEIRDATVRHLQFADHCLGRYIEERGGRFDLPSA